MKCIRPQKHDGIPEIVKLPSANNQSHKRMVALDVVRPKGSPLIDLMEGAADISVTCMRFIESEGSSPAFVQDRIERLVFDRIPHQKIFFRIFISTR